MTSTIRIAQVSPKLVGKTTHATLKVYSKMIKYMNNYALYLEHYGAHFRINDDAKKCGYLVSQIILYSFIIHLNCSHIKYF